MSTPYEISKMKAATSLFTAEDIRLQQQRDREKREAERQAYHANVYRSMPADLRHQAKTWGLLAFIELVWMNAWENGYRQAVRDANETRRGEK